MSSPSPLPMVVLIVAGREVAQVPPVHPVTAIRAACGALAGRVELRHGPKLMRAWAVGQFVIGDTIEVNLGAGPLSNA